MGFDGREARTPDLAVGHEWGRNLIPSVPADPIQSLLSLDPISKLVQGSFSSSVPQVVPKAEQALGGLDVGMAHWTGLLDFILRNLHVRLRPRPLV